jgi:dephospho-CoA kinase
VKTIAITGGIGAGKSTVARILTDFGYEVLSADQLSREVVASGLPAYQKIIAAFGPEIILPDGRLDRKKLGEVVFASPKLRRKLEAIVHPEVIARIKSVVAARQAARQPLLFIEVPLLFENGMEKMFDLVWVVDLSATSQLQRVRERDGLGVTAVRQRLAAQLPPAVKAARADLVLQNDGSRSGLEDQVRRAVAALQ